MKTEPGRPTLAEWQQSLAAVCEGCEAGLDTLQKHILEEPNSSEGLGVYRNNFLGARLGVFLQTFPRLLSLLGEDYLLQCGRRFLADYPLDATSDNLNHLGRRFPEFLRKLFAEKNELSSYPWLADLAKLEYARHTAYYAFDDISFDFKAFQELGSLAESIHLQTSNSLALIECEWPLYQLDCDIASGIIHADYPKERQLIAIYRKNFSVHVMKISEEEFTLLEGIRKGLTMMALLDQAGENAKYLPLFIQKGWVCGFRQGPHINDI